MRTIPNDVWQQLREPHNPSGIVDLWEIRVDQTEAATTLMRLVNNPAGELTHDGKTYYPFPVVRGEIEENSELGFPSMSVGVANYSREFANRLHQGFGFMGQPVRLTRCHLDHLDAGDGVVIEWVCRSARVRHADIVLELGLGENWNTARVPQERFERDRCDKLYKSAECAYDGSLPSCAFTLDACQEHGDDEAARGRPVMHPLQFGGFIGIAEYAR